jgi:hypothetical protein
VWRGVWDVATVYAIDDVVSRGGSSYIAVAATTGDLPESSPAVWSLLAQKGDTGAQGTQGIQGIQGIAGLNWRGAWLSSNTYALNDAVTYSGSSYRATASVTAGSPAPPSDPTNWEVVAAKGDPGVTGPFGSSDIIDESLVGADIADGTLATADIADTAVTSAKIADLGVETADIADLAVSTGKLADLGVSTGKLANLAVTTAKLADSAVTNAKLGTSAVDTAKLADNSVNSAKLAADAVAADGIGTDGSTDIASNAINSSEIATSAITSAKLASGAVTSGKIATDAVGSSEIADLAVATAELANQSVTTAKLADGAVTEVKLATDSVSGAKVTDGSLRKEDIGVLSGTATLDPPSLRRAQASVADMCANVTASVTGIAVGDQVILSAPASLANGITVQALLQPTADVLTVKVCNVTTTDFLDAPAADWGYIVIR